MHLNQETYTKHYIVEALFKLMHQKDYALINVTDITKKAGVGRASFYRYFKTKEDVLIYYFDYNKTLFIDEQKYIPRCKEDYFEIIQFVFKTLKEHKEPFKLLHKAHLEFLYLEYLNKNFITMFQQNDYPNDYSPLGYAGMLFNISLRWIEEDCVTPVQEISKTVLNLIFQEK